jgi:methionine-rich copper-binding protein CopC
VVFVVVVGKKKGTRAESSEANATCCTAEPHRANTALSTKPRAMIHHSQCPAKTQLSFLQPAHSHFTNTTTTMSTTTARRTATLNRDTNETKIKIALSLDGGSLESLSSSSGEDGGHASQTSSAQSISINSGIGFLDHMLHALAKHSGWSLSLTCQGDLHSTTHTHTHSLPAALS